MRVVLNGPIIDESPAGPAVHLMSLGQAMTARDPGLELVARYATLKRRRIAKASAARIAPHVRACVLPVPARYLQRAQERWGLPRESLLMPEFDLFHQFHTDHDPAVPGERLIVTLHDTVALHWPAEEGAMNPGAGTLLRRSAAVITVSEYSRGEICTAFGVDPDRVHVIHNGVDTTRFTPERAAEHREPARTWLGVPGRFVLFVGGGTPRKNPEGLLRAFADLVGRPEFADLHLVMAGPVAAQRDRLLNLVDGAVGARVHFPGFVPAPLLPGLYAAAAVHCCPSWYEGFGMPVLEAMACGALTVVSSSSSLPEVVGSAFETIDVTDDAALGAALAATLSLDEPAAAARRRAGVERVKHFSWERAADETLALYRSVVAARRGVVHA